ncbi:MAG TPA: response regulator transcription factor [Solirubrobacteraceae bacterium]|nr:response regulator transcription factor [Solirubrobacteraceae bacterium]
MSRRVLIVDDNPGFRRLARRLLEDDGFEVVGAVGDASQALLATGELAPEVILLDVNLPDASGFALAARIARERPGVAVLLTSTHSHQDFDELAVSSGALGFLPKDDLSGAEVERLLR